MGACGIYQTAHSSLGPPWLRSGGSSQCRVRGCRRNSKVLFRRRFPSPVTDKCSSCRWSKCLRCTPCFGIDADSGIVSPILMFRRRRRREDNGATYLQHQYVDEKQPHDRDRLHKQGRTRGSHVMKCFFSELFLHSAQSSVSKRNYVHRYRIRGAVPSRSRSLH